VDQVIRLEHGRCVVVMSLERRLVVVSPHCDDGVFGYGQVLAETPGAVV
jgi:hypothetical protein